MKQNSNKNRSNGRHNRSNNNRRSNNGITRNTVFDSCGPAGRIRGMATQLIEKYTSLAKDAKADDDRVLYETYMQYAEHYVRMLEIATANDMPKQHQDFAKEENSESVPEDNAATLDETSAVQRSEGENNECGMLPLENDIPGAEAAAKPNVCDAVEDAEVQNAQLKKRKRRIKIEKQNASDENIGHSEEVE